MKIIGLHKTSKCAIPRFSFHLEQNPVTIPKIIASVKKLMQIKWEQVHMYMFSFSSLKMLYAQAK